MVTRKKANPFAATEDAQPEQSNSWNRCCAWGCPMPGVWSDSTTPDPNKETKWQCSVHMALDPSQWQTATAIMKESKRVLQMEQAQEEIRRTHDMTLLRAFIREVIVEARERDAGQPRLTARATPTEQMRRAKDMLGKHLPAIRQPGEDDE